MKFFTLHKYHYINYKINVIESIRHITRKYLFVLLLLVSFCVQATNDTLKMNISESLKEEFDTLSLSELMGKGRKYYSEYRSDSAMVCFSLAANRFNPSMTMEEKELCISAMNAIGCIFRFFYYEYERAYQYFYQSLKLCNEYQLDRSKAITYLNLGTLLDDPVRRDNGTERSETAKSMYAEAVTYAVKTRSYDMLAMAIINMAGYSEDIDISIFEVLDDETIPDDVPGIRFCRLLYQGLKALNANQFEAARDCFERQLEVVDVKLNPELLTLTALLNISETYRRAGDYDSAQKKLDEALEIANKYHTEDYILLLKRKKGELYSIAGDLENGNKWYLSYHTYRDSVFNSRKLPSVEELNLTYDVLQNQEKVRIMNIKNRYQTYVIIVCVLLVITMVTFVIILNRKNRKLRSLNRSLYDRNNELMQAQDDMSSLLRACDDCSYKKEHEDNEPSSVRKYNRSNLSEEEKHRLHTAIDRIMNNPDVICKSDFTLSQLVQLVDSNQLYVSQVINEKYHVTFSILLGNCRIKEACRRMQEDSAMLRVQTLDALSESVGFKSRSTFVSAFKRAVGVTPSEYLSISRNKPE